MVCTGCVKHPRFRDGVPDACTCGAPPHPLAWLALLPVDQVLTGNQLRRLQEMRDEILRSESSGQ
jgi:hypothetical protein